MVPADVPVPVRAEADDELRPLALEPRPPKGHAMTEQLAASEPMEKPNLAAAMDAVAEYNSIVLRRMVPELVAYIERIEQRLEVARRAVAAKDECVRLMNIGKAKGSVKGFTEANEAWHAAFDDLRRALDG